MQFFTTILYLSFRVWCPGFLVLRGAHASAKSAATDAVANASAVFGVPARDCVTSVSTIRYLSSAVIADSTLAGMDSAASRLTRHWVPQHSDRIAVYGVPDCEQFNVNSSIRRPSDLTDDSGWIQLRYGLDVDCGGAGGVIAVTDIEQFRLFLRDAFPYSRASDVDWCKASQGQSQFDVPVEWIGS